MSYRLSTGSYNDPAAADKLVEGLAPRITRMAMYYARCTREDPDDLLQEGWMGLLEGLRVLDTSIGTPEQYLIQRARWRMLDAIKRAKIRRCASLDDENGVPACIAVLECDDDPLMESVDFDVFVNDLKDIQRDILQALMEGLTWRETGERLGCTSANVAYHVRQIRRRYQTWLNAQSRQRDGSLSGRLAMTAGATT